MVYRFLID